VRIRSATLAAPALLALWAGSASANEPLAKPPAAAVKRAPESLIQANSPPFSEGIFPCTSCHDGKEKPNTKRRTLDYHDDQQTVFDHDSEHRWCLDCHDTNKRDFLHLTNGDTVPFTESYRLCGQCLGDKLRDWRAGVHGKRVGMWGGDKTYFLCVNCHNPHTPMFKGVAEVEIAGKKVTTPTLPLIKPEPRPMRPEEMRK
jgi:hypothetical protein